MGTWASRVWLGGNEGMDNKMEIPLMGDTRPKVSSCICASCWRILGWVPYYSGRFLCV